MLRRISIKNYSQLEKSEKYTIDLSIDVREFTCPMPLLKTRLALHQLNKGQLLKVIATDSSTLVDMPAYCRQSGHTLVKSYERHGAYIHILKK